MKSIRIERIINFKFFYLYISPAPPEEWHKPNDTQEYDTQKTVKFMKELVNELYPDRDSNCIPPFCNVMLPMLIKAKLKTLKDDKERELINETQKLYGGFDIIFWCAFLPDELFSLPEKDVKELLNSTESCRLKDRWHNGKVYSLCKACANKKILNELPDNVKNSINHKNNWEFAECRCSMCKISYPLYEIGFCPKCYKSFCKECYESDKISKSGCPNCKFKCEDIHKCSKNNPFRFEVRVIQLPSEYLSTDLNLDLCRAQLGAHKKFELSKRGKK